jgi:hypothetical protein
MQGTGRLSIALADGEGAAGVVSKLNPEGVNLIVDSVVLELTTVSDAAGTVDVGIAATAVTADNLLDGIDVNAAAGVFDNITDKGANGKTVKIWGPTSYLTATKKTGNVAGLEGFLHVHYFTASPSTE